MPIFVDSIDEQTWVKVSEQVHKLEDRMTDTESEGEAAACAAAIQRLLFKHNLTRGELRARGSKRRLAYKKEDFDLGVGTMTLKQWKFDLFHAIASNNFCKVLNYARCKYAVIIGEDDNVIVVKSLYNYLEKQVRDLSRKAWKVRSDQGFNQFLDRNDLAKRERMFKEAFRLGAVATIRERLQEQRKQDIQEADEAAAQAEQEQKAAVALTDGRMHEQASDEAIAMGGEVAAESKDEQAESKDEQANTPTTGTALVLHVEAELNEAMYEFFPQLRPEKDENGNVKKRKRRGRPYGSRTSRFDNTAWFQGKEAGKSVKIKHSIAS